MFDTLLNQIKTIELPVEVRNKIEQTIEIARVRGDFEDSELEMIQKMLETCAEVDEKNAAAAEKLAELMEKLLDGTMDVLEESLESQSSTAGK